MKQDKIIKDDHLSPWKLTKHQTDATKLETLIQENLLNYSKVS